MEFECNNTKWNIELVDEAVMNNEMKNDYTLGVTIYRSQRVLLLNDQANILKTLKHELGHVWLYEYGHSQGENSKYDNEEVCEIIASSNEFINYVISQFIEWQHKNK